MNAPTKPGRKQRRKRTPQWLRRPGRLLSGSRWFAPVAAWFAIQYLRLTYHTNKWVVEPGDALDKVAPHLPVIAAVWHGQHILLPVIPIGIKGSVMISRSLDGEITARIAQSFGSKAIRASGGRDRGQAMQKGGISGFLEMLRALESGESVMQTADIPKGTPRRAGPGIIALAKRSGRPIIPLAVASSRRKVVKGAWDRTTFNLPFGRSAIVMGEPVMIAADAGEAELEAGRLRLQSEMERITARAYELTGNCEQ
jgi:lysophospholipid acyltransferase (LPLAT)-like uncharacterized protein